MVATRSFIWWPPDEKYFLQWYQRGSVAAGARCCSAISNLCLVTLAAAVAADSEQSTLDRTLVVTRTYCRSKALRSAAARHVCTLAACFSQSSEDAPLQTLLFVTPSSVFVVPVK